MSTRRYYRVRLPMYDWPEIRKATASLEDSLQSALEDALELRRADLAPWPENLDGGDIWQQPGMLLSQTCGYPLTHSLKDKVQLIGAPHYVMAGCSGPRYCSQLLVHADSSHQHLQDLCGKRAVFNGSDSQSGMNAFRHAVAKLAGGKSYFSKVRKTDSHLASMRAVANKEADIASIDAVCWGLACRELPELAAQLKPIAQTAPACGLPFITSMRFSRSEAALIADAVAAVFSSPETRESRERLGIRGFSKLSIGDYAEILTMEQEAEAAGYPKLA